MLEEGKLTEEKVAEGQQKVYTSDEQGIIHIGEKQKYNITEIFPSQDSISIKMGEDGQLFDVYDSMIKILANINNNHKKQVTSTQKKIRQRANARKRERPYITVNEILRNFTGPKDKNPLELFTLDTFLWGNENKKLYSCNNRRLCLINMIIRHSKKNNNLQFLGGGIQIKLLDSNKKELNKICFHDFTYKGTLRLRNVQNPNNLPKGVTSNDGYCLSGARYHIGGKKSRKFKKKRTLKKRKNKKKRKSVKKRL